MDWIDPRYATAETKTAKRDRKSRSADDSSARKKPRGRRLSTQVSAALAQPLEVWSVAFDHALSKLKWPTSVTAESSFVWSAVIQQQAEVLVRAGMSAKRLSSVIAEVTAETDDERTAQLAQVVGLMDQSLESIAFRWLDDAHSEADAALATAALAWHIPDHARRPGNEWISQWVQAVVDRMATYRPDSEDPVVSHLLIQCELPLLIGFATSVSKRIAIAQASKAMDNLAEYLERSEDDMGPWLVHGATYLRAALGSVLRCRVLADALGLRAWFPPQRKALANLLTHAARWSRADGTQLLAAGNKAPKAKEIWAALLKQTKKPKRVVASMVLSGIGKGDRRLTRTNSNPAMLPALTHYSPSAKCVTMQSDWRQKGAHVAVDFSENEICLEALGSKGTPALVGQWKARVELDGQAQLQLDEWDEVCWFSDDDVDYLELQAQFGQQARVQRQIMLMREERLLWMADALLCDEPGSWTLRTELPLPIDVPFIEEKKTTEGHLRSSETNRSLVMPLYLPEWKRQLTRDGGTGLEQQDDALILQMDTKAQRCYMPVLVSLCNVHAKNPYTWRQLTVAEDLRINGADEACSYRVQIGTEQWLFYRSLAEATRRTTLGMHTLADFYAGRFDPEDGEIDTLVEVEENAGQ